MSRVGDVRGRAAAKGKKTKRRREKGSYLCICTQLANRNTIYTVFGLLAIASDYCFLGKVSVQFMDNWRMRL